MLIYNQPCRNEEKFEEARVKAEDVSSFLVKKGYSRVSNYAIGTFPLSVDICVEKYLIDCRVPGSSTLIRLLRRLNYTGTLWIENTLRGAYVESLWIIDQPGIRKYAEPPTRRNMGELVEALYEQFGVPIKVEFPSYTLSVP
jgi:hypothetical protein